MKKIQNEDAPTVNAGSGNIAGIGVGPNGEPGVHPRNQPKKNKTISTKTVLGMLRRKAPMIAEETFAGAAVFEVAPSVFHAARWEKRKGKHWKTYLEEDDCLAEVREYAKKHPHKPIVLKNRLTGEMCYARYGKKG